MNRFTSIIPFLFLVFAGFAKTPISKFKSDHSSLSTHHLLLVSEPPCTAPVITSQPAPTLQTVCQNGTVTAISVSTSDVSATFQWYFNIIDSNNGGVLIPSATSSTYTPSSSTGGTKYFYCVLTNGTCNTTSNTVVVNVNLLPTATISNTGINGCSGTSILSLNGGSNINLIQWYVGSTLEKSVTVAPNSGITVAGGNGGGNAANQLDLPRGVSVDVNANVYVADVNNKRVQKWLKNAVTGSTVAGGNGSGSNANQLNVPNAIFVDTAGNIYVADGANNRIQKWAKNAVTGSTVAGGNGSGNAANQLNGPTGVFVDTIGNIYVSDALNHRVQKWIKNATTGVTVAGGNGTGSNANQLNTPNAVFVDTSGAVYVADINNNRIQKWAKNATTGVTVSGGNGSGSNANQLKMPSDVFVDNIGNVYITDSGNDRVQKWAANAVAGITVAGGNGNGANANQFNNPNRLFLDSTGNIYVSDAGNNRVQKWAQTTTNAYIPLSSGTYSAKVTANGCSATTNTIDINLSPTTTLSGASTVAQCATTTLTGTPTGGTWSSNSANATVTNTGVVLGVKGGKATITYSYTDNKGCSATSTQVETVAADVTPPTFTACPTDITANSDPDKCGVVLNFSVAATDNCTSSPTIKQTSGGAAFTTFPVGITTNTFTATDPNNNVSTCTFKITVNDITNPSFTDCPANFSVNAPTGQCNAKVNFTVSATDNCAATVSLLSGLANGAFYPIGTTSNSFVATDGANNKATCNFQVTVNPTDLPVIVCPADMTVNNDPGVCSAKVIFDYITASDNCNTSFTIKQTAGLSRGGIYPVGTTTNSYYATDNALRTSLPCSFKVTVLDIEKPIFTNCPTDITLNNDAGKCGVVFNFTLKATDVCTSSPIITKTSGLASGSSFPLGTTNNIFTSTDDSKNSSQCIFKVTVLDTEKPVLTCPKDITINNDAGKCGATFNYAVSATDNCTTSPIIQQTLGLASGSIFPIDITTNTFSTTDASNNSSTCSFKVTVVDAEKPVFTNCPKDITVNNDAKKCSAVVSYLLTATDNCTTSPTITKQDATLVSGSSFPVGITTNTFVATDKANNNSKCTFNVTIVDAEKPVITCPADISVNNDLTQCSAVVNFTVTATDNCTSSPAISKSNSSLSSGASFPVGITTNTFFATDDAFNRSSCSFNVTVIDAEKPFITCPADISVNNDAGLCSAVVVYSVTATDNCTAAPTITRSVGSLPSGVAFPVGTTTNTFTTTDAANNSLSCSFKVTVVDAEKPKIFCPADITVNNDLGKCSAVVSFAVTATDNCTTNPNIKQTVGSASGATFSLGIATNTFTATDAANNTSVCSFKITVVDAEKPVITCPADITVNNDAGKCGALVNYSITATDNCTSTVTLQQTSGSASGTSFTLGTTINSFKATDAANNSASCSFKLTVIDTEKPIFATCPKDITVNTDAGKCSAVVNYSVFVVDNCTASPALTKSDGSLASGSAFPVGTTINVFTATDDAQNTSTCTFKVTVLDAEKPVLTCPSDIKVNTDLGTCGVKVSFAVSATDNCSATVSKTSGLASGEIFPIGETINTFVATDNPGNTTSCTFKVTVTDIEKLTITSPLVSSVVCLRSSVNLTASATSTRAMTANWQRKGRSDANFTDITTASTYTSSNTISYLTPTLTQTDSATQYRVEFTTSCGVNYSDAVTLKVVECYNGSGLNPFPDSIKECLKTPFRVLEEIYVATNGANWKNKTNWLTEKDLSKWFGVTLTANGCDVSALQLSNNNLVGAMPQNVAPGFNEIALPALQTLDLSFNALSGNISNVSLPSLVTYNLSNNSFTGSIPNFNLASLQTLDVSNNQLGFGIPDFTTATKVTKLNIAKNRFIFGDIEKKNVLNITDLTYAPQALIPISFNAGVLSVKTGSADNIQVFKWYKDGALVCTDVACNVSTYTPIKSGTYYCVVTHNALTIPSDANKNLVLQSENFAFHSFQVDLKNLKGTVVNKKTQLDWQSLSEIKLDRFEIERSADTANFVKIGQVAAVGNSTVVQNYTFTDSFPLTGISYYRLKIFGIDGDFVYSNRVSVNVFTAVSDQPSAISLQLYPNPTEHRLYVKGVSDNVPFTIVNALGQIVLKGILKENTAIEIDDLPQSTYYLHADNKVGRFVKL